MADEKRPDMNCVPYHRKGFYFALTIPFIVLLVGVLVYLWTISFVLSVIFALLYLLMCFFQAYCCVYQECPYVGGFCPAIAGIMPASLLAKLIYGNKRIVKSKRRFELNAILAVMSWLGLVLFPLHWIGQLGKLFFIGYIFCHVLYAVIFLMTICPACSIRRICPGGRLGSILWKSREEKSE